MAKTLETCGLGSTKVSSVLSSHDADGRTQVSHLFLVRSSPDPWTEICAGHAVGEQIRLQSSGETWSSGMNRWSLDKFRHPRHEGSQRVELPRGEGVQGRR